jgi:hypothetical protein
MLGTSPVIIANESCAGIADGGRTGLTALVVAAYFGLALFFIPIFSAVPPTATAPALIIVGARPVAHARAVSRAPGCARQVARGLCPTAPHVVAWHPLARNGGRRSVGGRQARARDEAHASPLIPTRPLLPAVRACCACAPLPQAR